MKRIRLLNIVGHFVALGKPSQVTGKYGMRVILPKGHPQQKELAAGFTEVAKQDFGAVKGVAFSLRNADKEEAPAEGEPDPIMEGAFFFGANSQSRPGVLNPDMVQATDEDIAEFGYSGGNFHVMVNIASYEYQGKKGVTAYLQNAVMLGGGERIGGTKSAEEDFADLKPAAAPAGKRKAASADPDDDIPF